MAFGDKLMGWSGAEVEFGELSPVYCDLKESCMSGGEPMFGKVCRLVLLAALDSNSCFWLHKLIAF